MQLLDMLDNSSWQLYLNIVSQTYSNVHVYAILFIDLMHWRHVSITTTPRWGSRLVALRARVVLAERIGAQPLSKDCIIQDRKAHEKCEAYTLVMKIEKGAEWRQNTVLVHLGSSLKSKIISFLLIKKDFKIIVVAFFELRESVWRMRILKNKDYFV